MLLDDIHPHCFQYILQYLPPADIRSLFETNVKLASLIMTCIDGPPGKMLSLRNVSGKAEAVYHATSKELIYSLVKMDDWFFNNAIYEVVNLVISYPNEMTKLMKMFRSLQRQTSRGTIIRRWKKLNLICTQNAVITKELADELCQFQYSSFGCSSEHIDRGVTLAQFLKACEKAQNIWIMSPYFTTNFMEDFQKWTYKGDSECSIVFQNPSHEASIIELPPEESLINFCQGFPSHRLLLSIVIDVEELAENILESYREILSARMPEFEVEIFRSNRLTIKNISMSSFELFVIAANVLKTPTQIFLFDEEDEEEDSDDEDDDYIQK